jgi:hypothetical protein
MTHARHALLLLAAILLAACTNQSATPSPSVPVAPSATPSPSAPAAPTATAAAGGACAATDLTASAEGWSAAAGSRGADVLLENSGGAACSLSAAPDVAIVDDAATALLESEPGGTGSGPVLEAGGTATFTVLASNWCEEPVGLPFHLVLRAEGGAIQVTGLDMATADDLPPCNGPDQPATLSANPWVLP